MQPQPWDYMLLTGRRRVSRVVLTCLYALGSLLGCREAAVEIVERSVLHHIHEANVLPVDTTRIDVEALTNAEYQGGPVLVLEESRIAVANGPTGTIYLGTEGPRGLRAIDTMGGSLVGFASHPRQLRDSDTDPTLDGVSLLRSFEQLDDRRLRWENYPIRQPFTDSDPDLLASASSWAYREITAVALAVHDGEVYVLNTIHDNVQVFDASGRLKRTYKLLTRGPGNDAKRFELLEGSKTRCYGSAADLAIDENGTVFISRLVFRGAARGNLLYRTDVHDIDFNYIGSFATDQPGRWIDAYNGTLLLSSGGSFDPGLIRIDYGGAFE